MCSDTVSENWLFSISRMQVGDEKQDYHLEWPYDRAGNVFKMLLVIVFQTNIQLVSATCGIFSLVSRLQWFYAVHGTNHH